MRNFILTSLAIAAAASAAAGPAPAAARADQAPATVGWDDLRAGLESWAALSFDADFAVNVGDASGTLFTWATPGFSMTNSSLAGASLSKWPAAVMISGLVGDGTMSYDDPAHKYLTWWTRNSSDPRSRVTLRQLLSFTSGFLSDPVKLYTCKGSFMHCAQEAFESAQYYTEPGTAWAYLSCHLQFAGAMAVAASGKPIQTLFQEYLYKPFNMTKTSWGPHDNPSIAAGIVTTGEDFEHLLQGLLTYKVLDKTVLDQMETDYSKAPVAPSGDGWFGHYGMGHWWECIGYGTPNERAQLPDVCTESHIQAGPGEFGYYPLLDRSGGGGAAGPKRPPYYMQVVLQEPDALSGIPEYLRITAKPYVDVIMGGGSAGNDRASLLSQGAGMILRDLTYIESELGKCTCDGASAGARGEPFATLGRGLPADVPKRNRRAYAAEGVGLLLLDLAKAQTTDLGSCKCSGRK